MRESVRDSCSQTELCIISLVNAVAVLIRCLVSGTNTRTTDPLQQDVIKGVLCEQQEVALNKSGICQHQSNFRAFP